MTDIYKPRFTNGGDAAIKQLLSSLSFYMGVIKERTSPTFSREELVEAMNEATLCCSCEKDIEAALDALIAIGAVRVS